MKHTLALFFLLLVFGSCATMQKQISMLKPNQEEFIRKNLFGKTLKQVHSVLGHPASPGHWGVNDYAFIVLYPIGEEGSIATWKYGMAKKSLNCYFMRFDKADGLKLDMLEIHECAAPIAQPSRVDFDFFEANI